jgi:hypothetical protein
MIDYWGRSLEMAKDQRTVAVESKSMKGIKADM